MKTIDQRIRKLKTAREKYDASRTWSAQLREHAAELRKQAEMEIRRGHLESATDLLDRAENVEREADGWELEGQS